MKPCRSVGRRKAEGGRRNTLPDDLRDAGCGRPTSSHEAAAASFAGPLGDAPGPARPLVPPRPALRGGDGEELGDDGCCDDFGWCAVVIGDFDMAVTADLAYIANETSCSDSAGRCGRTVTRGSLLVLSVPGRAATGRVRARRPRCQRRARSSRSPSGRRGGSHVDSTPVG